MLQPRPDAIAAVRIKCDRRAEIRLGGARRQLRTHRPQQGAGAVRPPHQADAIARGPGLLHQPLPRCHDVRDPLAAGAHRALLDTALRAELARTVAVRQQHRVARFQQQLGPIAIARLDRFGTAAESAAAVQRDHGGKRPVTFRLVKLRVQYPAPEGNVDLMRGGQRRRIHRSSRIEKVMAKSVRNIVADRRRIGFAGSRWCREQRRSTNHATMCPSPQFITNRWGLQGGHRDLFMVDALRNIWPGPDDRGEAFGSEVLRRVQSC